MAERLTFTLDGRDNLSRVLNRAGDSADDMGRRIDDAARQGSSALARFHRDANGRLRDVQGRFLSAGEAARVMAGDTGSVAPALGDLSSAATDAAGSSGHLGGVMASVAAIAGLSLLPALGAVVPMAAGAGLAIGTLKLGFKGVGEAAALAGEDKKKYAAALKKLSPEARSFTRALVDVKGEFAGIGKSVQRAMLPGFTQALKSSGPLVRIVGRGMTDMGRGFGQAAAGLGRLMKDSGFQKDFTQVLKLGGVFVKDLTTGVGGLARGFLSFGAASGPTLRVLSGGIRDLLGKGLVGMFQGLERGIGGTSAFLSGLFSMLNQILPALGRFAGEVARTFGPLLGELAVNAGQRTSAVLGMLGGAVRFLAPIFKDLAFGVKATTQMFALMAPAIKDTAGAILGALIPAGTRVDEMKGPLQRLSESIEENKLLIQEGSRVIANSIINFVAFGVAALPELIGGFRQLSFGVLQSLDVMVSGAASAFGWIPGIGDKLRAADAAFDEFKGGFLRGLAEAEQATRNFSQETLPRLERNQLKMNIDNWTSQIATAKAQMKSVPPEKQAELKARINDLQAKVAQANRALASIEDENVNVTVTTRYVVVGDSSAARKAGVHGSQLKLARGGLVGFPGGGMVHGPGTGTSDSILARVSKGEFVVRAASVQKYGPEVLHAINQGRLGTAMPAPTPALPVPRQAAARPAGDVHVHVHFDDPALRDLINVTVEPKIRDSEQRQARRATTGRAL
ncbi:hypothetical protein ACGFMM_11185 [Streptomyces sp. NPDC048604]|uniref:hypothetical protein n=1 Tax=Streptomyces sp. NPDC048604 TaxID=3365578 RepID=UPI00371CA519